MNIQQLILGAVVLYIAFFSVFFIGGAFSNWSLNPGNWTSDSRDIIAICVVLFGAALTIVTLAIFSELKCGKKEPEEEN